MFSRHDDRIYLEQWQAYVIAILSIAFGFEGFRLLRILHSTVSYQLGVLVGAIIGFLAHEIAHSVMGRREGCIAHFVLSKIGLSLTLLFGLLRSAGVPFIILAPGYVQLYCMGSFTREDYIASAGPLTNIFMAIAAKVILPLLKSSVVHIAVLGFAEINAWIALFNLLPFAPLDGWRIFKKNFAEWIALFMLAIIAAYLL